MPQLSTKSIHNPEFARVLDISRLRDRAEFPFDIAPDTREAEALAALMGARSLRKMRFAGTLSPLSGTGWRLEADLGATVVQTCVVSLDPVTSRIDQQVHRTFLPQEEGRTGEVIVSPEDDDELEPLHAHLDLGLVAIEALALALPPYPRKPGVALPEEAVDGDPPQTPQKPFAALAALRDKFGNRS